MATNTYIKAINNGVSDIRITNTDETYDETINSDTVIPDTEFNLIIENSEETEIFGFPASLPSGIDYGDLKLPIPDTEFTLNLQYVDGETITSTPISLPSGVDYGNINLPIVPYPSTRPSWMPDRPENKKSSVLTELFYYFLGK